MMSDIKLWLVNLTVLLLSLRLAHGREGKCVLI